MLDIVWHSYFAFQKQHLCQWLPPKLQRRLSEKLIIKTVQRAYHEVPFYRELYDRAGIDINSIQTIDDLKRLPTISKDDIRQNYPDNIISSRYNINKLQCSATTGSTGKSLAFCFTPKTYAYYLNTSVRVSSMIGYWPWHKAVYIKYTAVSMPKFGPFFRAAHIPSTITVEEQIEQLRKEKPDFLVGYASIILEIARKASAADLAKIRPKIISVNSEMSTQAQRNFISQKFGCPVYDEYSTEETWMIAAQCKHQHYHVFSDNVWVEFLDQHGQDVAPGETGEIVLTTLRSPAMPFIRYRIGDMGKPSKETCKCGRGLPILESFEGRSDDSFILPSGRFVSSLKILNIFTTFIKKDLHLMNEFRVIQREPGLVEIELEPGSHYTAEGFGQLTNRLRELFGEPVKIEVKLVDKINSQGRIKRKAIESQVTRPE